MYENLNPADLLLTVRYHVDNWHKSQATENPKKLSSLLQIHHRSKFQRLPTSSALQSDNRRSINGFRFSRSKTKTYGECNNFKSRFSLKAGSNALSLDRAMLPRSASVLFKLIGYFAGLNGIFSYLVGAIIASTIVKLLLALFRGSSEEDDVERPSSLGGIIWSKVVNALKSIRSSETSSVEEAALDLSKWNVCKLQVPPQRHGPVQLVGSRIVGRIGSDMDIEAGKLAAQQVGLTILSTLKANLGSLDRIKRVIKVLGMVNCTSDFERHPYVINGCSELFANVWGTENGIGV
eukprot:gene40099-54212_t